ncbi:MAG: Crp/Fnr family transcriptional regulator [Ignavibacteriales bacterium]|nr:Crp/Fnr family transcriptional regulator [Ignavibacteriales bacterium]
MTKNGTKNIYSEIAMEERLFEAFRDAATTRKFRKNEIITEQNKVEKYLSYIESGSTAIIYTNEHGKKICFDLNYEGEYVSSYASFVTKTPSMHYVIALENTIILSIDFDTLENLYNTSKAFERMGRLAVESALLYKENRFLSVLVKSAEERYMELIEKTPDVLKRTPQKYIASYLGITPESLSRIRKTLSS